MSGAVPVDGDTYAGIADLVHRYADAVVHRDEAQWTACWVEDARWSLAPGRTVSGRDAIVELWRSAMGAYTSVLQVVLNGSAWRDGDAADRARARWYISETYLRTDGERGIMVAHYDDEVVCRDGGWRFGGRALRIHYRGPADLSGAFAVPESN